MTEVFSSNVQLSLKTERAKIGFRKALLVVDRVKAEKFAQIVDDMVLINEPLLNFAYDGFDLTAIRARVGVETTINSKEDTTRMVLDFILDRLWGMEINKGKPPKWS